MSFSRGTQGGFSLIEVLVTLVLVSIGVLGMVALQGRAIQYTQDSVQRNTAAMLANELVEMIRVKSDLAVRGKIKRTVERTDDNTLKSFADTEFQKLVDPGFMKAANAAFPAVAGVCSPMPQDADDQLACWANESVVAALPGANDLLTGHFYVCRSTEPGTCNGEGDSIEIQLAWRVKSGECLDASLGDGDDDTICRYRLMTRVF